MRSHLDRLKENQRRLDAARKEGSTAATRLAEDVVATPVKRQAYGQPGEEESGERPSFDQQPAASAPELRDPFSATSAGDADSGRGLGQLLLGPLAQGATLSWPPPSGGKKNAQVCGWLVQQRDVVLPREVALLRTRQKAVLRALENLESIKSELDENGWEHRFLLSSLPRIIVQAKFLVDTVNNVLSMGVPLDGGSRTTAEWAYEAVSRTVEYGPHAVKGEGKHILGKEVLQHIRYIGPIGKQIWTTAEYFQNAEQVRELQRVMRSNLGQVGTLMRQYSAELVEHRNGQSVVEAWSAAVERAVREQQCEGSGLDAAPSSVKP